MSGKETPTPMKQLLDYLQRERKVSREEVIRKTGIKPSVLSGFASGARTVSKEGAVAMIKAFPDVNAGWLLTGEGEMFLPTPTGPSARELELEQEIQRIKARLLDANDRIEELKKGKGPKPGNEDPGVINAGY